MCYLSYDRNFMLYYIGVMKIDNSFLTCFLFLIFSVVVDIDSSGVLALDASGDSVFSTNREVSMVLPFVL